MRGPSRIVRAPQTRGWFPGSLSITFHGLLLSQLVALVLTASPIHSQPVIPDEPDWRPSISGFVYSVVAGDVDNDGDLDLVVGGDGSVSLYLNQGRGFREALSWTGAMGRRILSVALGDVDGNGYLDLVCARDNLGAALFRNTNATFPASPSWSPRTAESTTSVALGDVDGDGDLDLVCGNSGNRGQANTLYRNNEGVLESTPTWSSVPAAKTAAIALGDINGDGRLDLVCGNSGFDETNRLVYYAGYEAAFTATPVWRSERRGSSTSVALGDVDEDGNLDLICSRIAGKIEIYLNAADTLETTPTWETLSPR